ncbi:MAG: RNA methyltransferase, partial [Isosphaeraceae bacterium]
MPSRPLPIDDLDDPRLAIYRDLKTTNQTRGSNQFVVEGLKLAERLWSSRFPVVSVLASARVAEEVAPRVPDGVSLFTLPLDRLERLVGFNFHQGVLASGRRLPWPDLGELVRDA